MYPSQWVRVLVVLLAMATAGAAAPKTLYVNAAAAPGGDGQSWATAFQFVQDALGAAFSGDDIWVAAGRYRPDQSAANPAGTLLPTDSFVLVNGVELYGGFAGYEDPATFDLLDRDFLFNETILSGDLLGNDNLSLWGADLLNDPCRSDNAYHVLKGTGITYAALLDGFSIMGGHAMAASGEDSLGGALLNSNNSNPRIRNCRIAWNTAQRGGAIYNYRSSSQTEDTQFVNNAAVLSGGAIHNGVSLVEMVLTRCTFAGCFCEGWGGAAYNNNGGMLRFESCLLAQNRVWKYGNTRGGAIDNLNSDLVARQCTFAENVSDNQGGAIRNENGTVTLAHNIFWDNEDSSGKTETAQVHHISGALSVAYCCLMGWTGGWGGPGNFDQDPLFGNALEGDYHLQSQTGRYHSASGQWAPDAGTSPCIDAGDPAAPIGSEVPPHGARRNLGVYGGSTEASKSYFAGGCGVAVPGDVNGDCDIDLIDVALVAAHWLD